MSTFRRSVTPEIVRVLFTLFCTILFYGCFSLKYLENVNHLLDLLEEKNPNIYKHSERVAMMCYAFGKRFDLDGKEREKLYLAGFLHEIGKINFDDEITIEKKKMITPFIKMLISGEVELWDGKNI